MLGACSKPDCGCPLPAAGEPDVCHAAVLIEAANT